MDFDQNGPVESVSTFPPIAAPKLPVMLGPNITSVNTAENEIGGWSSSDSNLSRGALYGLLPTAICLGERSIQLERTRGLAIKARIELGGIT